MEGFLVLVDILKDEQVCEKSIVDSPLWDEAELGGVN